MGKGITFTWSGEINPTNDPKQRRHVVEGQTCHDLPETYETLLVEGKGYAVWAEPVVAVAEVAFELLAEAAGPAVEPEPEPAVPSRRRR